jgi:hypothetical protein
MSDEKVDLYCHNCDTWQPTTAEDNQRKRCRNCKTNIVVKRYPELHPQSDTNTRPYTAPTRNALATRKAYPSPVRRTIPGTVIRDTDPTPSIREIANDITGAYVEHRERKASNQRQASNPLRAQTPPDSSGRPCEFCAHVGIRGRDGRFPVATHELTMQYTSEIKLACPAHVQEMRVINYAANVKPIQHRPNPGPNYHGGIGNVPENQQLAGLRAQAEIARREQEIAERARANQPGIVDRISGVLSRYQI